MPSLYFMLAVSIVEEQLNWDTASLCISTFGDFVYSKPAVFICYNFVHRALVGGYHLIFASCAVAVIELFAGAVGGRVSRVSRVSRVKQRRAKIAEY